MPTPVLMPQMGESVAEGTIVRWIKRVGDQVERDEPLFEISTDKVDAEIPSPVAGVLTEIKVNEGDTVPVSSVVALIGEVAEAEQPAASARPVAAPRQAPSRSRRCRHQPPLRRRGMRRGVRSPRRSSGRSLASTASTFPVFREPVQAAG